MTRYMAISKIRQGTPPPELPRHLDKDFERFLKLAPSVDPDSILLSPKGEIERLDAHEQIAFVNAVILNETQLAASVESQTRLTSWVRYTQGVLTYALRKGHITDLDQLATIGNHEETTLSLAALFSHNPTASEAMVKNGGVFYDLSDDGTHITTSAEARHIVGRVDYSHTTNEDKLSLSDEFLAFSPWNIQLAARAVIARVPGHLRKPIVQPTRFEEGKLFDDTTFEDMQSA